MKIYINLPSLFAATNSLGRKQKMQNNIHYPKLRDADVGAYNR